VNLLLASVVIQFGSNASITGGTELAWVATIDALSAAIVGGAETCE
jgi:hypothetical protein